MAHGTKNGPAKHRDQLAYHAAYYREDDSKWVVVTVLDFPGAVSQGRTLSSARRMIRDALRMMAECLVERGEPLPRPNPKANDKRAFFAEEITLRMRALTGAVT